LPVEAKKARTHGAKRVVTGARVCPYG